MARLRAVEVGGGLFSSRPAATYVHVGDLLKIIDGLAAVDDDLKKNHPEFARGAAKTLEILSNAIARAAVEGG